MKLGAAIPEELYQAVVEIYVYFLGYVPDAGPEEGAEEDGEWTEEPEV
jgi:flagellar biosynthesis protein